MIIEMPATRKSTDVLLELGQMIERNREELADDDEAKSDVARFLHDTAAGRPTKDLKCAQIAALRKMDNRRWPDHLLPEVLVRLLDIKRFLGVRQKPTYSDVISVAILALPNTRTNSDQKGMRELRRLVPKR